MMVPNYEIAYVPEPKLTEYLLSEKHAVGKAKTKYLRFLGYNDANVDKLQGDLIMIVKSND
jgi:hypothetical protein